MPRFELRDGRANKRWSLCRHGAAISTTWGTVGAATHGATKRCVDAAAARQLARELIRERQGKGYVRMAPSPAGAGFASSEELERAVLADLDATDPLSIYADWLSHAGDRRGELGALQLAAALGDEAAAASARALLAELEDALVGACHSLLEDTLQIEWRAGFADELRLTGSASRAGGVDAASLRPLLEGGTFRFLRVLESEGLLEPVSQSLELLATLERAPPLVTLSLSGTGTVAASELAQLAARYPRLEQLSLDCGEVSVGPLAAPRLLSLSLSAVDSPDAIAGLLGASAAPRLRELRLRGAASGLPRALASAPLTRQLSRLDLRGGWLDDEDALALIERFEAFRHLDSLEVEIEAPDLALRLRALQGRS